MTESAKTIRFLHGRCLRLESCRKALVWQKRYLQRVLAGYHAVERELAGGRGGGERRGGKGRFKCAVTVVIAVLRMSFLVRRRVHVRAFAAAALAHRDGHWDAPSSSTKYPRPAPGAVPNVGPTAGDRGDSLARRVLRQEMRVNLPASPGVGDFARRSPYNTNSPREEAFILSSPRGEVAAAYLNKLDLVSRCLSRALDIPRDAP